MLSTIDAQGLEWGRVDSDAFRRLRDDSLVPMEQLKDQLRGNGEFVDETPWPRPDTLLLDARYGVTSYRVNVTQVMMKIIGAGEFPGEVGPAMFDLNDHSPDIWDLTLTWHHSDQDSSRWADSYLGLTRV
jgi:hypothetical protein